MKKNKLAIIIPYYKTDFFEETVKSVSAQTNKNFTLYIGNDASPHDPLPIILKYFKEEEFNYYNYIDNFGGKNLALQWERILENVQEDWFQILGDDDMISDNFVNEFYQSYSKFPDAKAIKFKHKWIDENSAVIKEFDYKNQKLNSVEFFIKKYRNEVKSSLSENIFRTDIYRKTKFEEIPLAWGSDDLALLSFSDFSEIIYNRKSTVQVRISESSISGSQKMIQHKKMAFNFFRKTIIKKYTGRLTPDFIENVLHEYIYYCHVERQKADYFCACFYLKKMKIKAFFKTVKKIYQINKLSTLEQAEKTDSK